MLGTDPTIHGLRVLVVEDHPRLAQLMKYQLGLLGCTPVDAVHSADDARNVLSRDRVDLVLLDAHLADGPAYEFAAELCARHVHVLLSTGADDLAIPIAHRDIPRLTKPYTEEELARELVQVVSRARSTS